MKNEENLSKIVIPLVEWYKENARMLPWRETKNPYTIWLSEIMLQQTKIEAVKKYYARFIKELPTIEQLAKVEEEKLLKLWEGLGYYNRARNLKKAAIQIQENYEGKMPTTYEELLTLAGIGEYTAGAIASIAYDEKVPAVDGNVLRVISRIKASKKDVLLLNTKKEITEELKNIMPKEAGMFNEGLMELGERICIPNGQPLCSSCPIKEYCLAYNKGLTDEIPVRIKQVKRRKEQKTVLVCKWKNTVAIRKRIQIGLLANMYEFPNIEGFKKISQVREVLKQWNLNVVAIEKIGKFKHIFSHVEWEMLGYRITVEQKNKDFIWVNQKELQQRYAIPTAFEKFKNK